MDMRAHVLLPSSPLCLWHVGLPLNSFPQLCPLCSPYRPVEELGGQLVCDAKDPSKHTEFVLYAAGKLQTDPAFGAGADGESGREEEKEEEEGPATAVGGRRALRAVRTAGNTVSSTASRTTGQMSAIKRWSDAGRDAVSGGHTFEDVRSHKKGKGTVKLAVHLMYKHDAV